MKEFSTRHVIEELWSSKEVTDEAIIRMIYAYYANYVTWTWPESVLGFDQMRDVYEQSQELLASFQSYCDFAVRTTTPAEKPTQEDIAREFLSQLSPSKRILWESIYPARYQLRMLGDVGATLLMVADIVSRTINPESFQHRFYGVDLGTGSGILLAGQEVLARRNGFRERILHGIEMDPQVANKTRAFCQGLWYMIHEWDTTQAKTWTQLPYMPLTCVTNENIPAANERMHREPFIQNMWILWNTRRELIQSETAFVPKELQIIRDPTMTEDEVRYICSPQNWFFPWELHEDITLFSRAGLGNLYEHLIPDCVKLANEVVPLKLVSPMGAERMWVFGYKRSFLSRF